MIILKTDSETKLAIMFISYFYGNNLIHLCELWIEPIFGNNSFHFGRRAIGQLVPFLRYVRLSKSINIETTVPLHMKRILPIRENKLCNILLVVRYIVDDNDHERPTS